MKIITAQEMARLDKISPVKAEILMDRAGRGLANFIQENFPSWPVCFICGSGNNGGDGLVAARYLVERNREVEVYAKENLKGLAKKQAGKLKIHLKTLKRESLSYSLERRMIVVDCLLGTGFEPPLRNTLKDILEIINKKSKIIIACDIPTGVNGDTGQADKSAVRADCTVTFGYPKVGHYRKPGSEYSGSIENIKIGLEVSPKDYLKEAEFITREESRRYFTKREKDTHKKTYGHILVIGGSPGMDGAPIMAAQGAVKSGAGLVTLGLPRRLACAVSSNIISAMSLNLKEDRSGFINPENFGSIKEFIEQRNVDVLVLGPGLGTGLGVRKLVVNLLEDIKKPVVLDADGLNNLAGNVKILKTRDYPTVITPHPGEMSGLIKKTTSELLEERIKIAKDFAGEYRCVTVLKGYRTVVTDGQKVFINTTGNPGMATGGSGDVLTGIISSLIGQNFGGLESAKTGVWIHGRAGDISSWSKGEKFICPDNIVKSLGEIV